jgi:hypothetical protein
VKNVALLCMHRLREADAILTAGRTDEARAIVAGVRADLREVGEALTAPLSLALMFVQDLERRIG